MLRKPNNSYKKNDLAVETIITIFSDIREWANDSEIFKKPDYFFHALAFALSYRKPATDKKLSVNTLQVRLGVENDGPTQRRLMALLWDINELYALNILTPALANKITDFLHSKDFSIPGLRNELIPTNQAALPDTYKRMESIINKLKPHHNSISEVLAKLARQRAQQANQALSNAKKLLNLPIEPSLEEATDDLHRRIRTKVKIEVSDEKVHSAPSKIKKPIVKTSDEKHQEPKPTRIPSLTKTQVSSVPLKVSITRSSSISETSNHSVSIVSAVTNSDPVIVNPPAFEDKSLSDTDIVPEERFQITGEASIIQKTLQRPSRKPSLSLQDELNDSDDEVKIDANAANLVKPILVKHDVEVAPNLNALKLQELIKVMNDIKFWNQKTSYKFLFGGVKTKIDTTELRVPRHIAEFRQALLSAADPDVTAKAIADEATNHHNNKHSGYRLRVFKVRQEPMDLLMDTLGSNLNNDHCSIKQFKAQLERIRGNTAWQPLENPVLFVSANKSLKI